MESNPDILIGDEGMSIGISNSRPVINLRFNTDLFFLDYRIIDHDDFFTYYIVYFHYKHHYFYNLKKK